MALNEGDNLRDLTKLTKLRSRWHILRALKNKALKEINEVKGYNDVDELKV